MAKFQGNIVMTVVVKVPLRSRSIKAAKEELRKLELQYAPVETGSGLMSLGEMTVISTDVLEVQNTRTFDVYEVDD